MQALIRSIFGAHAQVVVGIVMLLATAVQTVYWTVYTPPTVMAVFLVSMEALFFTGYGVIATGLGYRAAERIEAHVDPEVDNVEHADTVKHADVVEEVG